jgi:hypothetical protein
VGATRLVNNVELDPSHAALRLAAPLAAPGRVQDPV